MQNIGIEVSYKISGKVPKDRIGTFFGQFQTTVSLVVVLAI